MSRERTERIKAVRKAWEREQQLVAEGEGTRDWTPEQQKSILDIGVALDDEGRPFEGQHMKCVASYPEYAGDPDNIQFLTRQEHLEAHRGNWQNPSNWYYNPVTKEFIEFEEEELIPCQVFELSNPIVSMKGSSGPEQTETASPKDNFGEKEKDKSPPSNEKEKESVSLSAQVKKPVIDKVSSVEKASPTFLEKTWNFVKTTASAAGHYVKNNPWKVIGGVLTFVGAVATAVSSSNNSSRSSDSYHSPSEPYDSDSYDNGPDDSGDENYSDNDDTSIERDYPDERSSPREHDVSGYDRQQNGKTVHVNPYKRGGKKEE